MEDYNINMNLIPLGCEEHDDKGNLEGMAVHGSGSPSMSTESGVEDGGDFYTVVKQEVTENHTTLMQNVAGRKVGQSLIPLMKGAAPQISTPSLGVLYSWDPVRKVHRPKMIKMADKLFDCVKCKKKFCPPFDGTIQGKDQYTHCEKCLKMETGKKYNPAAEPESESIEQEDPVQDQNTEMSNKNVVKRGFTSVVRLKKKKPTGSESGCKNQKNVQYDFKDGEYVCKQCSEKFPNISDFKVHWKKHLKKIPHVCNECGKVFKRAACLKKHLENHQKPKNVQCEICQAMFHYPYQLERHMVTHNNVQKYVCEVCGKKFKMAVNLKYHQAIHGEETVACDLCDKHFPSDYHVKRHKQKVHPESGVYRKSFSMHACYMCGKEFLNRTDLEKHELTHTERERNSPCSVCGKLFYCMNDVTKHMKSVHKKQKHQCNFCDKSFSSASYLKKHENTHTGENLHVCKHCGKSFITEKVLRSHEQIHTGEKKGECELCGKKFRDASYMKLHMKIHTGHTRFKCDTCGEGFLWAYTFEKHKAKCEVQIDTV